MGFCFESPTGETIWFPALRVGTVYVDAMRAHANALGVDLGLRIITGDTASVELPSFTALVDALVAEYARSNHTIRRRQIEAAVPESIVLAERSGATVQVVPRTERLFALATEIAPSMPTR